MPGEKKVETLIMDTDLSSLHSLFPLKLPSMDSSIVMVLVNDSIADKVQQWTYTHGLHWS